MDRQPLPHRRCPLCGEDNRCAPAASGSFAEGCWCAAVKIAGEVLRRIPQAHRDRTCICPRCARTQPSAGPAQEPE
ncbi:MAG TPA: cysteine-rich CWC family protein [Burkholderiaceae bacterium]|nr:cysteine-rich CWC family protein [Burkholderiaceae bacterium]